MNYIPHFLTLDYVKPRLLDVVSTYRRSKMLMVLNAKHIDLPLDALSNWVGPLKGDFLDIGSRDSSVLTKWVPRKYTGVEPDLSLVEDAKKTFKKKSYKFVHSETSNPWDEDGEFKWDKNQTFDAIFCLHDFVDLDPNWNKTLAIVSCLLKEGGVFVGRINKHMWFDKIRRQILPKWFASFETLSLEDGTLAIKGTL